MAHAADGDFDEHVLVAHLRHLDLFNSQRLANFVKHCGFHRRFLPRADRIESTYASHPSYVKGTGGTAAKLTIAEFDKIKIA